MHPKVSIPAIAGCVVGLVLVILGVIAGDPVVKGLGLGAVGQALVGLGIGYKVAAK